MVEITSRIHPSSSSTICKIILYVSSRESSLHTVLRISIIRFRTAWEMLDATWQSPFTASFYTPSSAWRSWKRAENDASRNFAHRERHAWCYGREGYNWLFWLCCLSFVCEWQILTRQGKFESDNFYTDLNLSESLKITRDN